MPFKKGESGNISGRPLGSKNLVTEEIRKKVLSFLDENFELIELDIRKLEPKERVKFYIDLLQFSLPKLRLDEMQIAEEKTPEPDFSLLTMEELKQLKKIGIKLNPQWDKYFPDII